MIVIAGGGLAAVRFCQTLRRAGDDRPIVLVSDEPHAPYDRPPLSKELDATPLRPDGWYADNDIHLLLCERAASLDLRHRVLHLESGLALPFDALLIATGSRARTLPHALAVRTLDDARALRARLVAGARVVVVGGGFIGQEVASTARSRGAEVTMVEPQPQLLAGLLGERLGAWFTALHREEGVRVELGAMVREVRPGAVELTDGRVLESDVTVAGIGVVPNLEWLGGVIPQAPGVFAAGDVTGGQHWEAAVRQGTAAARELLGLPPAPPAPASFWSDQHGVRIQMVGHPAGADSVEIEGDPGARDFTAVLRRQGHAAAVLLAGRPHALPEARRLVEAHQQNERKAA